MTITMDRDGFAARYDAGEAQLVWRRVPDDVETPVSAALKLQRTRSRIILLESVEGGETRGRYSIIAADFDLVWRVRDGVVEIAEGEAAADADAFTRAAGDPHPLEALRTLLAQSALAIPDGLPSATAGVFGYLGYEMTRHFERLPEPKDNLLGLPQALLMRPRTVIVFDSVRQDLILATPVRPSADVSAADAVAEAGAHLDGVAAALAAPLSAEAKPKADVDEDALAITPSVTDAAYRDQVERAKAYIRAGDIFQCVPSIRYATPFAHPPFALYRALRRLNPSPYMFYLGLGDSAVVGSSPEILVKVAGNRITLRPIAGTRPRGANPAEDAALEAELLADPKERAEHLMLLDLGRNDVGRAAAWGSVAETEQFIVERYSHVMHIVSQVEGDLREGLDAVDALFAGFPAGTVSGAPKVRAMEIIHELEDEARGVYAGGVGYFSANGDMDTCIALRTGVVKDGVLHVRAGGGVVYDSDPEAERLETVHKARAVFRAAADAVRYV